MGRNGPCEAVGPQWVRNWAWGGAAKCCPVKKLPLTLRLCPCPDVIQERQMPCQKNNAPPSVNNGVRPSSGGSLRRPARPAGLTINEPISIISRSLSRARRFASVVRGGGPSRALCLTAAHDPAVSRGHGRSTSKSVMTSTSLSILVQSSIIIGALYFLGHTIQYDHARLNGRWPARKSSVDCSTGHDPKQNAHRLRT